MKLGAWPRSDKLWLALVGLGAVHHAALSLFFADRTWTTSTGVAPFCLLACAACIREGPDATREMRWRWILLAAALLLWASAWVALGYLTSVHANYHTVKIDSLLNALRCVPLLLLLAPIGEGDEQPVFRLIDGLQGLLSVALITILLFPTWFDIGHEVVAKHELIYRDGAYTTMALISVTGLAIQRAAERQRLVKAVAVLLVSQATLAWFGNHLIIPHLGDHPGSIAMIIADVPFILFLVFVIDSRHRPFSEGMPIDPPAIDLRLIGPACFTAFLLLLAFAVSDRSVAIAIFGGLATILLYLVRSTALQTLYLRSQAEIARTARARAELLATISHEIRSPLCSVILNAEQLYRQPGAIGAQTDLARQIHLGTDAVVGLLNDMLEFARLDAGAVRIVARPYDALQVARDALDLIRSQAVAAGLGLHLTEATQDAFPAIGDAARLRQVLVNLLANAVRFTPSGGRVTLTVITLGQAVVDRRIRITVTDTGVGMSANMRRALFEPFMETEAPSHGRMGSGLGLMISRKLMELMGGALDFESREGGGSRFWIDVPIEPSAAVLIRARRQRSRLNFPGFAHKPAA